MKKFIYLFYGFEQPTPEVMQAWGAWFELIGDKFIDSGNPFGAGMNVTPDGSSAIAPTTDATAYSIVQANDLDEAVALLDGCPIIDSVQVYECVSM